MNRIASGIVFGIVLAWTIASGAQGLRLRRFRLHLAKVELGCDAVFEAHAL